MREIHRAQDVAEKSFLALFCIYLIRLIFFHFHFFDSFFYLASVTPNDMCIYAEIANSTCFDVRQVSQLVVILIFIYTKYTHNINDNVLFTHIIVAAILAYYTDKPVGRPKLCYFLIAPQILLIVISYCTDLDRNLSVNRRALFARYVRCWVQQQIQDKLLYLLPVMLLRQIDYDRT